MSITIGGALCEELVEGLQEGIDERGPFAAKKYLCNWGDRYAVANGLLGLVTATGQAATFTVPMRYPESANMFANRVVSIEGKGKPTQGARQLQFPYAVVTASFGIPAYQFLPTPAMSIDPQTPFVYATQEIDIGLDSYTIPASAVQVSGGAPLAKDQTITYAKAEISLTMHRFPYDPSQDIFGMTGALNIVSFLGCEAGKVRFNGGKTSDTASSDGTFTKDVSLSFSYRKIARWDYRFHPNGTSGWVALQDKSGNNIYTLADFNDLIPDFYRG
jgi:hypothetical protein